LYEQAVEIALGPKGAFEVGSIGTLKRRVAADRVVNVAANARRPAKPPPAPRTPMVVELLRKAQEWRRQIEVGEVKSKAEIALRERVSRARITQIMGLLRLTPDIQQQILAMPEAVRRPGITEHGLRPIAQLCDPANQDARFAEMVEQAV
jgi:hypothetical protein